MLSGAGSSYRGLNETSEAEIAGIRFGIMSAIADPDPAPSLASET